MYLKLLSHFNCTIFTIYFRTPLSLCTFSVRSLYFLTPLSFSNFINYFLSNFSFYYLNFRTLLSHSIFSLDILFHFSLFMFLLLLNAFSITFSVYFSLVFTHFLSHLLSLLPFSYFFSTFSLYFLPYFRNGVCVLSRRELLKTRRVGSTLLQYGSKLSTITLAISECGDLFYNPCNRLINMSCLS